MREVSAKLFDNRYRAEVLLALAVSDSARDLAHAVNDAGASLVQAHPKCFGLLASLPLPAIDLLGHSLRGSAGQLDDRRRPTALRSPRPLTLPSTTAVRHL
ncbi:hypothetical protein ABZT03_36490 [Streptomyces sp. NPDC005574]|uniref:hypothetical protein n=1 Tax=Streptomyces sp. NPDC005574 TaxID=3156891 RepID=UPI0033A4C28F